MKTGKNGGKAFAEGGYGCVFRPALKCLNVNTRPDGVSKLMVAEKAKSEYTEVTKFLKVLSKIPNYKSLFMFPDNMCKLAPLDKKTDLVGFNKKCEHLKTKAKITGATINKHLDKLLSITLPDGGNDVDITCRHLNTSDDFLRINNSLIRLLKYGIIPMNYYKVYHFDVKDTNVLVDDDFTTRLTDWGLSGMVNSKESIPSIISNRPMQSNLPFSNILFNPDTLGRIADFYQFNKKEYTYELLESFMRDEFRRIEESIGTGHYDYLEPIYNDVIYKDNGYDFKNEVVGYLTQVVYNWKHPEYGFDLKKYFFNVFLPNADIWGFVTIYFAFFTNSKTMNDMNPVFYIKLKRIILTHLLDNGHKPINLSKLVSDLNELNTVINGNKVRFESIFQRTPDTKFIKSTKTITFNALLTVKRKHVEKIMKRAYKNKTQKRKSSSGKKTGSVLPPKSRKKRGVVKK